MADKEEVKVKLGAETGNVDDGLRSVVSSVTSAVDKMTAEMSKLVASSVRTHEAIAVSNNRIAASFQQMSSQLGGVQNSITSVFTKLNAGMAMVTTALAGGAAFSSAINKTMEFNASVMKLSKTMGVNSDAATTMVTALHLVGVEVGTYEGAYRKFEMQLRRNSAGLKALGVDTESLKNGTKTSMEVFNEAIQVVGKYKQGHDQLQVAMQILGSRGVREVQNLLKLTAEKMKEAEAEQRSLGLTVTEESMKMQLAYKQNLAGVQTVFTAIGKVIAETMMPRLTQLAVWFREHGPQAVEIMRNAMRAFVTVMDSIKTVAVSLWDVISTAFGAILSVIRSVFGTDAGGGLTTMQMFINMMKVVEMGAIILRTGFTVAFEFIKFAIEQVGNRLKQLSEAMSYFMSADWSGAVNAWNEYDAKIEATAAKHYAKMKEMKDKAAADLAAVAMRGEIGTPKGTVIQPKGGLSAPEGLGKHKQEKDERMAIWRDELREKQEALGFFNEMTKAQEAAFWEERLATLDKNLEKDKALWRQVSRIIYDDKKAFAREEQALRVQDIQTQIQETRYSTEEKIRLARLLVEEQRATWGEGSKQYKAALAEEVKFKQQQVEELKRLDKMLDDARLAGDLRVLAIEKSFSDLDVAMGRVSAERKFAVEVEFENRAYELHRQAMQDEIDQMQVGVNATYQEKMAAMLRLESLTSAHEARVLRIKQEAILEAARYEQEAIKATQDATAGLLNDLISHTKTLKESIKDFAKQLTDSINKLVSQNLMEKLIGPGTGGQDILSTLFGGLFGTAGGTKAMGATAADASLAHLATVSEINATAMTSLATQAAAAAVALGSVAATGGAGAGAGIFGKLLGGITGGGGTGLGGLGGSYDPAFSGAGFALAAGTNYVPRDMMAMVHKGEAVVPAKYNNKEQVKGLTVVNNFTVSGEMNTRTQDQIAAHASLSLQRAAYRTL